VQIISQGLRRCFGSADLRRALQNICKKFWDFRGVSQISAVKLNANFGICRGEGPYARQRERMRCGFPAAQKNPTSYSLFELSSDFYSLLLQPLYSIHMSPRSDDLGQFFVHLSVGEFLHSFPCFPFPSPEC
jgi:hypothetical protein